MLFMENNKSQNEYFIIMLRIKDSTIDLSIAEL